MQSVLELRGDISPRQVRTSIASTRGYTTAVQDGGSLRSLQIENGHPVVDHRLAVNRRLVRRTSANPGHSHLVGADGHALGVQEVELRSGGGAKMTRIQWLSPDQP